MEGRCGDSDVFLSFRWRAPSEEKETNVYNPPPPMPPRGEPSRCNCGAPTLIRSKRTIGSLVSRLGGGRATTREQKKKNKKRKREGLTKEEG